MSNAFTTVVELNEAVKQVVRDSDRLYLTSLNAMFTAKQVGAHAVGFQSVTSELRRFSHAMTRRMAALSGIIYALVQQVSELQKIERMAMLLRQAHHASAHTAHAAAFDGRGVRSRLRQAHLHQAMARDQQRFLLELHEALRLCLMGENLAVLAKVEAAGAGRDEWVRQLALVAGEVGEKVDAIQAVLVHALRRVEGTLEKAA